MSSSEGSEYPFSGGGGWSQQCHLVREPWAGTGTHLDSDLYFSLSRFILSLSCPRGQGALGLGLTDRILLGPLSWVLFAGGQPCKQIVPLASKYFICMIARDWTAKRLLTCMFWWPKLFICMGSCKKIFFPSVSYPFGTVLLLAVKCPISDEENNTMESLLNPRSLKRHFYFRSWTKLEHREGVTLGVPPR